MGLSLLTVLVVYELISFTASPTEPISSISTPSIQYSVIGTSGKTLLVVVDPINSTDRNGLMVIANYLCSGKDFCYILFWDNISKAATSLPATEAQDQAIIATYGLNTSTGYEELLVCGLGDC
jgi:hypothetical protein